ncbi:MAG TPA: isoprenylcysteine carboxylmethyltransferase family protein [Anaerolineales bacterium]|nr:isoprenylcysteine carboxylmethyltransferase family protein [Anaerolineales bacterium]
MLRGVLRWAGQMISALVIFGALLFLVAGRLDWMQGWVYLGMNALTQALSAVYLIPRRPDMLAERSQVREGTKGWDRLLAPAILIVGTFAVLLTAGLDVRFGWSEPIPGGLWWAGLGFAFASQMFVLWAMASNPYFATTVRIQADRNHTVSTQGPYRLVRHPGYAGSLVYNLALPLVLGARWVFIPALLTIVLTFLRTALEDRTLQKELAGYREYASQTRYRLIPGVW